MESTDLNKNSWQCPKDMANNYLHNYPTNMKYHLGSLLASKFPGELNILDVGCGNAQIYPILKKSKSNIRYTGIDISKHLSEEAKRITNGNNNAKILHGDLYKYISQISKPYDISILCHMLENFESPEYIIKQLKSKTKLIAILWYDFPLYDYDSIFIQNNFKDASKPILRRKMGKDYWNMIVNKYNLKKIYIAGTGKNILEVYSTN